MTITTKIKGSVTDKELAPYIKDGGIPNQADLNFGNEGDKKHSEIPKIVPLKGASPEKLILQVIKLIKVILLLQKVFSHILEKIKC